MGYLDTFVYVAHFEDGSSWEEQQWYIELRDEGLNRGGRKYSAGCAYKNQIPTMGLTVDTLARLRYSCTSCIRLNRGMKVYDS